MAQPQGPSQPSLIERWISILPLPFAWAAATWAILLGIVAPLLAGYVGAGTFDSAFRFVTLCGTNCTPFQIGTAVANGFLFFFFPGLMARRMRMTLVREEQILSSISSTGRSAFDSDFSSTSRKLPQLVLTILTLVGFTLSASSSGPIGGLAIVYTLPYIVGMLGLESFIWTYFASLRGVHRFGQSHLVLRDPVEDTAQGSKPLGSITLSLTFSYFGVIAVGLLWAMGVGSLFSTLMITSLTVIGAAMFFLPLNSLHQKMVLNKDAALSRIRNQLNELARKAGGSVPGDGDETAVGVLRLIGTDILDKRISTAHTWPFDTSILGRFFAVVLSVTAALVVAVVRDLLRF